MSMFPVYSPEAAPHNNTLNETMAGHDFPHSAPSRAMSLSVKRKIYFTKATRKETRSRSFRCSSRPTRNITALGLPAPARLRTGSMLLRCAVPTCLYMPHPVTSACTVWSMGTVCRSHLCGKQGGSDLGQLALRRPPSAPDRASGYPELRPASANRPLGPRWPAISVLFST